MEPPLYHSNIQLAFDPTMGWLSILITSWTSLDAPGTMSPVLNETVTSFRCIVIKDMEKLKKNETDSRALNQGYKL